MADKTGQTRRATLTALSGLSLGLAGCTAPLPLKENEPPGKDSSSQNKDSPSDTTAQEDYIPPASWAVFGNQTDDFRSFEGTDEVSLTNDGNPNTSEVTFTTTENTVTVEHDSLRVTSEINAELWMIQNGQTEQIGVETVPPNSEGDEQNYGVVTMEFDDKPEPETNIPVYYTLVFKETQNGSAPSGRLIKTAREIHVPYETPSGAETTHKIPASEATHEANESPGIKPEIWNSLKTEELDNGDKLVYGIANHDSIEETYGLATQIEQSTFEDESGGVEYWLDLTKHNTSAENFVHLENIATQFRDGNTALNKNTMETIASMTDFISNLPYEFRFESVRTPTECLTVNDGRNCTEKTTLFNALLQCEPFNYTGEDAGYLHCLLRGTDAHLIAGINVDKIDSAEVDDWTQYQYSDRYEVDYPDTSFIAVDVTTGEVGELADSTTSVWGMDNLDAEHLPNLN